MLNDETHWFSLIERAGYNLIGHPPRAGSDLPETALSSARLTCSVFELADQASQFLTNGKRTCLGQHKPQQIMWGHCGLPFVTGKCHYSRHILKVLPLFSL